MIDSVERRIAACWNRTASVAELIEWLEDDREWSFGGTPNFDGDATQIICRVSETAVQALAKVAPAEAPIERVAAAMVRAHGRIHEISTYTWTSPLEVPFRWRPTDVAAFGPRLGEALRAMLADADADTRRRAGEVLDEIGATLAFGRA